MPENKGNLGETEQGEYRTLNNMENCQMMNECFDHPEFPHAGYP